MSRGLGKVQRVIEALFAANPDDIFRTEDLVRAVYPEAWPFVEKKHRVAATRAARLTFKWTGWSCWREERLGGQLIYFNRRSVISYALARMRTNSSNNSRTDEALRNAVQGKPVKHSDQDVPARIRPGGSWH